MAVLSKYRKKEGIVMCQRIMIGCSSFYSTVWSLLDTEIYVRGFYIQNKAKTENNYDGLWAITSLFFYPIILWRLNSTSFETINRLKKVPKNTKKVPTYPQNTGLIHNFLHLTPRKYSFWKTYPPGTKIGQQILFDVLYLSAQKRR